MQLRKLYRKVKVVNKDSLIRETIDSIMARRIGEGGFSQCDKGNFNPVATAWASLALVSDPQKNEMVQIALKKLSSIQGTDGRIVTSNGPQDSFWPTFPAIFSWRKVGGFDHEIEKAIKFVLSTSGKHWKKNKTSVVGHDPSLIGWPWIENTHSWIEPTSMALLALKACGQSTHNRVNQAVNMILDRQLPTGGWNYGNTGVFGKTLRPEPESTGLALTAIAGYVELSEVVLSITYLKNQYEKIKTPLALSWTLFGLACWKERPKDYESRIKDSFKLQERYGKYDTSYLSKLVVAYKAECDLLNFVKT